MSAHIADGVKRGDDPEEGGNQGEHHAQRFYLEREFETRQQFGYTKLRLPTCEDFRQELQHTEKRKARGDDRDDFALVRPVARHPDHDSADQGQDYRKPDVNLILHQLTPIRVRAASSAILTGRDVSTPKYTFASTSIHAGISRLSGASLTSLRSFGGSRK